MIKHSSVVHLESRYSLMQSVVYKQFYGCPVDQDEIINTLDCKTKQCYSSVFYSQVFSCTMQQDLKATTVHANTQYSYFRSYSSAIALITLQRTFISTCWSHVQRLPWGCKPYICSQGYCSIIQIMIGEQEVATEVTTHELQKAEDIYALEELPHILWMANCTLITLVVQLRIWL